ncbi:protein-(glutamine-N5) methyltransferase, release factor-specific [Sphingorhabdus lutea]|uniref:peptide chain release factor N(5)-glutamine methyltransferase n=1 Tax=Sphingorhabdus lutea TaxID=1913578 RepID=A0A1L3JFA1_9SPHN|nr:protein-(glutamine-N5) methyltransferase, release factor-specific [Sphingorhabdus lutea]
MRWGRQLLHGISDSAALDAELLLAHALNINRQALLLGMRDFIAPEIFAAFIERRMQDEPIAYIIGRQAFWDFEVRVTPDTLIPRADSEVLVEIAQQIFAHHAPKNIIDLGTGSGILAIAAKRLFPGSDVQAMDQSVAAVEIAAQNAADICGQGSIDFHILNWRDGGWMSALRPPYDLILCNPPYVELDAKLDKMVVDYEPASALFSGADGMDDYKILMAAVKFLLADNGICLFEIGHEQGDKIKKLADFHGLKCDVKPDYARRDRVAIVQKS